MNFEINFEFDQLAELEKQLGAVGSRRSEIDAKIEKMYQEINKLRTINRDLADNEHKLKGELLTARLRKEEEDRKRALERELKASQDKMEAIAREIVELSDGLLANAHDYQVEDIISTVTAYRLGKRGMLNANGMGMGKTIESALVLYILVKLMIADLGYKPAILWLTKKSLVKKSTPKEILRWWPTCKIVVTPEISTVKDRTFLLELYEFQKADIFIANYEFVRTTPKASEMRWDIVVVDEVHKLKGGANANGPTAIWTACKDLMIKSRFNLMLSGTPMVNAPEEMWSYLHIFNPDKFPSIKQFRKDFMAYRTVANEMELVVDPNRIMEFALKGQMIRRSAGEVGLQIPELTHEIIELEMDPQQRAVYDKMATEFFIWLDEQEGKSLSAMAVIAQLIRLRQINIWPVFPFVVKERDEEGTVVREYTETLNVPFSSKIDEAMDIIETVGDQVVIFSTLNHGMEEIQKRCNAKKIRCEVINGSTKHDYDVEAEFQQGRIQVLCINSAMGEGLNLQKNPSKWPGGSRYGIMLDRWYSPARNEQCIKRIHRQGDTQAVFFYELTNEKSVDAFLISITDSKSASFANIMDHDAIRPASEWKNFIKGLME